MSRYAREEVSLAGATHGKGQHMNTTNTEPPTLEPSDAPSAAPRAGTRRRRSTPRGRREIGAHWHRRGEWRSFVTGGVAQPKSHTTRSAWMSIASVAAVATVAGAAIGIGATRLGWLPSTGATPIVLAALAFAASGAFAILACCVEIDSVIDRDGRNDRTS
ncbi:MAG: hypothetical protein RLY21_533 [Planctomycetota bacterium]